jgi:SAM-dependent methyltransferase
MNGGYEEGYLTCPCFWGTSPGSLVQRLEEEINGGVNDLRILDAGCGEGKNSIHLARRGATVKAFDVSSTAIQNALSAWPDSHLVDWQCADIRDLEIPEDSYDVVIAYGLLHCLSSQEEVAATIRKIQEITKPRGFNVICAFNDRSQDLRAHPNFYPCLLPHEFYLNAYRKWRILSSSDSDLHEVHPHNRIPHSHSMTRILACR